MSGSWIQACVSLSWDSNLQEGYRRRLSREKKRGIRAKKGKKNQVRMSSLVKTSFSLTH